MNEAFLYHVWKYRLFNTTVLQTINGDEVHVLKPGEQNPDSGPDFFNARLRIGETEWAGNVEIDTTSADWFHHGHHTNKAFSKIILHVVYELNKPLTHGIPVVELKKYIDTTAMNQYEQLQKSKDAIPCSKLLHTVPEITWQTWLERMVIERIEQKSKLMEQALENNKGDWEVTFYHLLARNFGFKTNAVPFELLAKSIPLSALAKQKNNLLQLEALLFGQAGLLNEPDGDDYYNQLKQEYKHLALKFSLAPMEKNLWKFARMRPVNFPSVRIAQFAALVHQSSHLFSKIIEVKEVKQLHKLFEVQPSDYWKSHYHFAKKSTDQFKALGQSSIDNILINTISPFLFVYGKLKNSEKFRERALSLLEQCRAENNTIIRLWKMAGVKPEHAWHTQGLIQLKNQYCNSKQCLKCAIGIKILKQK